MVVQKQVGSMVLAATVALGGWLTACSAPGVVVEAVCARTLPTATATYAPPAPPVERPMLPAPIFPISPSPEPSPSVTPSTTLTPIVTATLMPPLPGQITPRPTDLPFTPPPPPALPRARDITAGDDGCYAANVDGCLWTESSRRTDARTGDPLVILLSPCEPGNPVTFNPRKRRIEPAGPLARLHFPQRTAAVRAAPRYTSPPSTFIS